MWKNTENSYGLLTKIIHWLVGIIILTMLAVGFIMTDLEPSDQKWELYGLHKATGLLVLSLVTIRLMWKLINTEVLLPADLPEWQRKSARIMYLLLYIAMFTMPFSGILMSVLGGYNIGFYGIFTIKAITKNPNISSIFQGLHQVTAYIFCALVALHISAALYHHFIRKDNVLIRMIKS